MLLRHADFYGILEDVVCLRCFQTCQAVVLNWAEPKSKKGTDYIADPSSHVSAGECAVAGPSGPGVSIALSWGHSPARSDPSSCSVLAHVQLSTSGGQKRREQLVLYSGRINQWCCRTSSYSLFYINSHNQYMSNRSSGQRNVLPAARNHSQGCQSSPEPQLEMGHCCRMAQSEGNERCWCRMNTPEQDCCCASLF